MTIPAPLQVAVRKIQDTNLICPTMVSQAAALSALEVGESYCAEKTRDLPAVRELAVRELATISDLCSAPRSEGAFYFFLKIRSTLEPLKLVERLVKEHGVAAIPGTAFGVERGCSLRVAFGALGKSTAAEGIGRLARGLRALAGRT
jgi:aspartate/methionine/tyrosine aminotransferase